MKKKINIKGLINKKENIAIITVALIFCAGLVITKVSSGNIPLHDGDVLVDSQSATNNENLDDASGNNTSFEEKRAALDLERNNILSKYDDTIKNSDNKTEKENAVKAKESLLKTMKQEVEIEGIILSKNMPSAFVIISENNINVAVDEKELKQDVVAKICSIVMKETGKSADKIVIQSSY